MAVLGFGAQPMPTGDRQKPRRRQPVQERSRATVDAIVEGAARVFHREGWGATTNRIAEEAGVSVGSLYEYFPNKQALLVELATRHVDLAERGVGRALGASLPTRELLPAIQRAVLESQRFPSHALTLIEDVDQVGPALRERAEALRARVIATLTEHATRLGQVEPALRAEACFGALCELTARAMFTAPERSAELAKHYLAMASTHLGLEPA